MDYESENSWVRSCLHPGENLLWTGKPCRGHLFEKQDLFMIPFSLIWCGFAVVWELSVLRAMGAFSGGIQGTPSLVGWVPALFGVPFVLVGLYFVFGRFLVRWIQRKNTCYALTSHRLFRKRGSAIKTVDLLSLPAMTVRMRSDGTGSICFGAEGYAPRYNAVNGYSSRWVGPAFVLENLEEVNQVELKIRNAQTRLRQSGEFRP